MTGYGGVSITTTNPTERFEKDYRKLDPDLQNEVDECLKDLLKNPMPNSLKFEKLSGHKNPNIYTVHVTGNNSHKISMEVDGDVATLRRVRKHKPMDRAP